MRFAFIAKANRPGSVRKRFVSLQVYRGFARSVMRRASVDPGYPVWAEPIEAMLRGVCRSFIKADEYIGRKAQRTSLRMDSQAHVLLAAQVNTH